MSVPRSLLAAALAMAVPLLSPPRAAADTFIGAGGHAVMEGDYKGYGLSAVGAMWGTHLGVALDVDTTWPSSDRWKSIHLASPKLLLGVRRMDLFPHVYAGLGGGVANGTGLEDDFWANRYEAGLGLFLGGLRLSIGWSSLGLEDLERSGQVIIRLSLGFRGGR
jgi:hypothetical protein